MGTRADFYVGRGKEAEWLGSIAWDGYEIPDSIRFATTPEAFREAVDKELKSRDDATFPQDGWPWPWEDSNTTDYAYAFDEGVVWVSPFGRKFRNVLEIAKFEEERDRKAEAAQKRGDEDYDRDEEDEKWWGDGHSEVFPNMKDKQKVVLGKRSGVMIFGQHADGSVGIIDEDK